MAGTLSRYYRILTLRRRDDDSEGVCKNFLTLETPVNDVRAGPDHGNGNPAAPGAPVISRRNVAKDPSCQYRVHSSFSVGCTPVPPRRFEVDERMRRYGCGSGVEGTRQANQTAALGDETATVCGWRRTRDTASGRESNRVVGLVTL